MNNTNYKETENFPLVATPLKAVRRCPDCGHRCDPNEIICPSCGAGNIDKRAQAEIDEVSERNLYYAMGKAADEFNKILDLFHIWVLKGQCFGYQFFVEDCSEGATAEVAEDVETIKKWLRGTGKQLGLVEIKGC